MMATRHRGIPRGIEILDLQGNIRRKDCPQCGHRFNEDMFITERGVMYETCPFCRNWGSPPNYDGFTQYTKKNGKVIYRKSRKYKKADW